ncbi:MAG: bifunctional ADP-dependent NAD(P)H-hydrate dehydratase/NAD(P)H-hydrate epimerase [Anaerolineae bacterium]
MKIVTTQEMRRIETEADAGGLSFDQMMENAGRAVAQAIDEWIGAEGTHIVILVGPGNNGGDGLVAARHLAGMGAEVHLYVWKRKTEADKNWDLAMAQDLPFTWLDDDRDLRILRGLLAETDVVVDALLGTGVTRPIEGDLKRLLDEVRRVIEERRQPLDEALVAPAEGTAQTDSPLVVALDVPSGLNSDDGALDPAALPADLTVTLAAVKRGHVLLPGAGAIGKLVVGDIGIPPDLYAGITLEMATPAQIAALLPARPAAAHKGTFGKALVVAGSVNYTGAAYLAAGSATRVGTGLVTLAPPQAIFPIVAARLAEATYLLLPHDMGVLAPDAVKVLSEKVGEYDALLLGPGFGREKPTEEFLSQLLGGQKALRKHRVGFAREEDEGEEPAPSSAGVKLPPLVVDADGLNLLARIEKWWTQLPAETILTPHPGEMARLMGCETAEVQADRIGCATRMAAEWGHVVVLKGAYTVVAAPAGQVTVLPFANPAMATAGSGDVLAGAIVGMRAQGLAPFEAALVGAYLHGLAGELARSSLGDAGVVAGDLMGFLPLSISRLKGT